MIVSIGPGLFARTREQKESLLDWARKLKARCAHEQRDPRGMCYTCGDVDAAKARIK